MNRPNTPETLIGCPDCDLLVKREKQRRGYDTRCPRCGSLLAKAPSNSIARTLALSLSGLCLFFPACLLPLLTLNIFGHSGSCSMIKGVVQMVASGYWWMSFLVLFCSVLVPLTVLSLLSLITGCLSAGTCPRLLVSALKLYQALTEWAMLDVYMIGILIALVKMKDYGDIFSGPGLYCFVGLLGFTTLAMLAFDPRLTWNLIEKQSP